MLGGLLTSAGPWVGYLSEDGAMAIGSNLHSVLRCVSFHDLLDRLFAIIITRQVFFLRLIDRILYLDGILGIFGDFSLSLSKLSRLYFRITHHNRLTCHIIETNRVVRSIFILIIKEGLLRGTRQKFSLLVLDRWLPIPDVFLC